jgi:predicted transcriptional regulator
METKKRFSNEDLEKAKLMRTEGKKYHEIAAELGFSICTIFYHLSPKTKEAILKFSKTYNASPAGKEARRKYGERPEIKEKLKAYQKKRRDDLKNAKNIEPVVVEGVPMQNTPISTQ